jgi:dTDP-4-dehydrorhamnose 3,5-epimerase
MRFLPTDIPGVIIVEPIVRRDGRGFFLETFHATKYAAGGIRGTFVQDNHSSSKMGTIRGLHAQSRRPQGKLVRVIDGEIYDVALDIRRGSPHFGRWVGTWLSAAGFRQVFIPPGFAHGFCVVTETAQVEYKCTDVYDPESEFCIRWDDPALGIDWPLDRIGEPFLSDRDRVARPLAQMVDALPWFDSRPD